VNIITLRQRAHEQKKACQALLDTAQAEGRDLTVEESAKWEEMVATLNRTAVEVAAEERRLDIERGASGSDDLSTGARLDIPRLQVPHPGAAGAIPRKYAEMFPGALTSRGFASREEFFKVVHSGLNDPRLQAAVTGHGGASPTDGGFFIPESYAAEMLDVALESEIVRPRARVYPMTTQTRKLAGFDDLDNSGGAPFGGLSIQWANEGDTGTNKKTKTRLIQLNAQKGMIFSFASNELIADGMSFDEMLGSALIRALGWGLDNSFLNGDGAGKPMGVLKDPALIVVSKESAQATNTLLYANVVKMFSRLHPSCVQNSVWVANNGTIPALLQMQLVVQNVAGSENVGGSATPVVAQQDGKFTLLTRPVIFTEKVPAFSSQGDISLIDFSQYAVGIRREISLEKSASPGWQTDESAYRCIVRVDGQGRWNKAFTPKNGSTLSWCVTLQAR